ncbi:MAG: hypothetical protein JW908_03075 [Anaerolineales bacterium]|nr:hypothetical protein [Anaerolineales bacterium]
MDFFPGFPLIHTKMMIPAMRDRMVHRSHLINRIDEGINRGFVLVCSPPGYGKTTLIADWAQQTDPPVAWLSLDEQDNHLPTLNRYFRNILEFFFPSIKQHAADFPPEGNAEEYFHYLMVALINGCSQSDTNYSVVLDDYQVIQNPHIHEEVAYLIEHFPNHLRLIMSTRNNPPFPLSRLHANNQLLDITEMDLTFSETETKEFLNETVQLHLTEEEIQQYFQQTEGWVTGLQLLALSHIEPQSIPANHPIISEDSNVIQEYLIEEVINHQPPDVQDFLLRTSILDNLTDSLCDYVQYKKDNQPDRQELVRMLYHSNLFLIALDKEERWFRYHPLFAETLRHLLNEKYPEEVSELYIRASEWCDKNGLYQQALSYAYASGDRSRFIALLEKYAINDKNRGVMDFMSWIRKIDEDVVSKNPTLCIIYAWGLMMSFELDSSEIWMEKAKNLLDKKSDSGEQIPNEDTLWGLTFSAQSTLAVLRGDTDEAFNYSKKAITLLSEENSLSYCFTLLDRAIILSFNGEIDEAISILDETIRVSQASGVWLVMMIARSLMGELLIDKGQLSQAMILFQQSLTFVSKSSRKFTGIDGFLYKEMGEIFLIRNQLSEARQYLLLGCELSLNWLPAFSELDSHLRLAHLNHCLGNIKGVKEELSIARHKANISQGKLDDLIIEMEEAKFNLLRGQITAARKWTIKYQLLEKDNQNIFEKIPVMIRLLVQTLLARFFLAEGRQTHNSEKFSQAIDILNTLVPSLVKSGLNQHLIEVYILLALSHHELDQTIEMHEYIEKALILAEPEEIRQPFIDEGIPMARILNQYLGNLKQTKSTFSLPSRNFVSDIIFRFTRCADIGKIPKKSPDPEPEIDAIIVELLTARETEVLTLAAQGRTNNEIAQTLFLSVNTVKRHLNNIFQKLGVTTRTQAIAVARHHGWIQ